MSNPRWHSAAICRMCWGQLYPHLTVDFPKMINPDIEPCWECGQPAQSGIYVRRRGVKGDPQ